MGQDEYFWSLAVAQFSNNCKSSSCKSATSGSAKKATASAKKTSSKSSSCKERFFDQKIRKIIAFFEVEKMKKPLRTESFFVGGIRLSGTLFPRGNDISPNFGIPLVAQLFPADFF